MVMPARSFSAALQNPRRGFFDPAACPGELPVRFHACRHARRNAWKRFWQRFRSAPRGPPR
eukprot:1831370-Pyramimonas_sp.AAC.1